MDDDKNSTPLVFDIVKNFTLAFTAALLAMTITGMILGIFVSDINSLSTLFGLKGGLSYSSILQIAGFSLIITLIAVFLFSGRFITKMKYSHGLLILFLASLITVSVFSMIFKWFPSGNIYAWIGFIICFIICYVICAVLTTLKIKLERKKFGKLLENYRERQGKNGGVSGGQQC